MSKEETEAFVAELGHPVADALSELCDIIRAVDPRIRESIKWNAPNFSITGDFATTNLGPRGGLRLVLHAGAKKTTRESPLLIVDDDGLLQWKDGSRAVINFASVEEVRASREALRGILRQWIAQTQ